MKVTRPESGVLFDELVGVARAGPRPSSKQTDENYVNCLLTMRSACSRCLMKLLTCLLERCALRMVLVHANMFEPWSVGWSERAQPDTPRLIRYELCVTGASIPLAAKGKVLVIKPDGCRSQKACRVHGGYDKSRVECWELHTHRSDHNRQLAIPKRTSQRLTPCDALLCFHSGASYSVNAQRNVASNAGQKEY